MHLSPTAIEGAIRLLETPAWLSAVETLWRRPTTQRWKSLWRLEIATLGGGNGTHRRQAHKSFIRNDLWA
jgi:hypothetical protein